MSYNHQDKTDYEQSTKGTKGVILYKMKSSAKKKSLKILTFFPTIYTKPQYKSRTVKIFASLRER